MYLFIAIIFIAELIVAGFVVYWLIKLDKKAKAFSDQWIQTETDSIKLIKETRGILSTAKKIMGGAVDFVVKKRREIKRKIINLVFIYLILIIFKTKFKRAAMALQYIIIAQDIWKSIPS